MLVLNAMFSLTSALIGALAVQRVRPVSYGLYARHSRERKNSLSSEWRASTEGEAEGAARRACLREHKDQTKTNVFAGGVSEWYNTRI